MCGARRRTIYFLQEGMEKLNHRQRTLRFGASVMVCVFLMLMIHLVRYPLEKLLSSQKAVSFLIYLETGRVVEPMPSVAETEPPQTTVATEPAPMGLFFSEADAALIQVSNFCNYTVDIPALLTAKLQWDLTQSQPQVLIVHSHATESYTQTAQFSYTPSAAYRTLDTGYNMVRVGQALKEALEEKGITVIHDTTLHDYPSYNDSYIHSRETVQQWLAQYPSVSLVIDLHRDAAGDSATNQLSTATVIHGTQTAQLMLVVGSNAGGRLHPDWKANFALAAKLHAQLEKRFPGLCRPISFRTERFNQDLSAGALLIEVGAAGDTLEDALTAVGFLAEGIWDLALGTVTAGSTS